MPAIKMVMCGIIYTLKNCQYLVKVAPVYEEGPDTCSSSSHSLLSACCCSYRLQVK